MQWIVSSKTTYGVASSSSKDAPAHKRALAGALKQISSGHLGLPFLRLCAIGRSTLYPGILTRSVLPVIESRRPLTLHQVNTFQSSVAHLSMMQQYIIFVGLAVSAAFDAVKSPNVFDTSAPGEYLSRSIPKS